MLKYERPKDDLAAGPQPAIVWGGGGAVSQPLYAEVASPGHKSLDWPAQRKTFGEISSREYYCRFASKI